MMRKILILALSALSLQAFAQSAAEEAIILNQELQFLEDSINTTQALSINSLGTERSNPAVNDDSLEEQYFNEMTEEDSVSTRTAGPKRRGL